MYRHDRKDRVLQVLATCAYNVQRAIEILDNAGLILNRADALEIAECLQRHLQSYAWLASYSWGQRKLLFLLRPKHHCIWHLAKQISEWRLNLNLFHCFDEESFLGKIKNICVKTHGRTATKRVFQRYILCLAMMLEQHRRLTSGL